MDEFEEILRLNALREEIIKRYEALERNFTGTDLRNIRINYPCFMDVNFSGVNLEGSVFNGIYLVNTSFRSANLERSHLRAFIY
ncbi:hypothetical protein WA1_14750 [Scytonema hofmannii PCC 7110]|uniref:Pentapeptide repeat-containing protein n=1 Tax=Scytonema hofmannii PCC 7110 TaxID=128403 RepID=A0A139XF74_9CYAN|nr:hypothetical protein WA1_14750 [Scytonema hofmannii PCC 7110]